MPTMRFSPSISAAPTSVPAIVQLNLRGASDLSKAKVWKFELWRHGDEKLNREEPSTA